MNGKDDNGWTALIIASQAGRTDIMRILIGAGADVNVEDNNHRSVLFAGIHTGTCRYYQDAFG